VLLTASAFQRIWASDFWWQLKAGELIASSGLPSTDPFSFTAGGSRWVELRWIYLLALHLTVRVAGFPAVVVLKWLAILAAFGLVAGVAVTRRTIVAACAVLAVAILASSQRFFVRPELATFLLFAGFVWVLARGTDGDRRLLWALPALQVLWVNTHTLFALGPLLIGLQLLVTSVQSLDERRARSRTTAPSRERAGGAPRGDAKPGGRRASAAAGAREGENPRAGRETGPAEPGSSRRSLGTIPTLALVLAASVAACLVNPYGASAFRYAWLLFEEVHGATYKLVSAELRSPFSFSQSYAALTWYEVLIGVCAGAALLNVRRLPAFWTLLLLAQFYLSATAVRNLPLFALAAVPFVLINLRETPVAQHRLIAPRLPAARRVVALAVVAFCGWYTWSFLTDRFNVRQGDTNQLGAGIARHRYPEGAVRFLRERGIDGPIFSTMLEGGYLLAHDYKVFIDGRLEVYGEDRLARFLRVQEDPAAWAEAVREYGLRAAVLDHQGSLARRLLTAREWSLVHFDEVAAVFVRGDLPDAEPAIRTQEQFEKAVERLRARLPRPPAPATGSWLSRVRSPAPFLRVADFLLAAGRPELAEPFARDALAVWPETDGAHAILASVRDAQRDLAGAAREYEAALRISPGNIVNRRQLALVLYRAGRRQEAAPLLERTVRDLPSDSLSWAMLTNVHAQANRVGDATACAERAVALAPRNPEYRKNLGRLYAVSGNVPGAILALRRAHALDPRDASVCRDLGALHIKAGRLSEAIVFIDRGLALNPGDSDLEALRARARGAGPGVSP